MTAPDGRAPAKRPEVDVDETAVAVAQIFALLAAKRFETARGILAPLLAGDPHNSALWQLAAIADYGAGRNSRAQDSVTRALALSPNDAELHLLLAQVLFASDRVGEGVRCAERALAIQPDFPEAHAAIATALARTNHAREWAVWHAMRARDLEPDSASAHYAVGSALMIGNSRRNVKQAFGPLHTALRLDPQFSEAWNSLAVAHLRRGRAAGAVRGCVTALQLDPQAETAAHNLPLAVWLLVFRGRWWVLGFLVFTALMSVAVMEANVISPLTSTAVHAAFGLLVVAASWWLLVYRLLRVFPKSMRPAARAVLWRDRLVRPVWLGEAWAMAWQFVMVVVPWWHPGMIWACMWAGVLGIWVSTAASQVRLRNARERLERERAQAWWGVVNTSRA